MCDKDPQKIKNMFHDIASYYDQMNNFMSFFTHKIVKKSAIKMLNFKQSAKVLDLCCGTGDFTGLVSANYPDVKIIGLDFSKDMLKIAKHKYPWQVFITGDCTDLPFSDEFDYVLIGFGLRNIQNRELAISQIYKSLKNGGEFLHLDFGIHNFASKIFDIIVYIWAKILKKDEKIYKYLINSKNDYPEPNELIEEFEKSGFKFLKRKDFLFGVVTALVMKKN